MNQRGAPQLMQPLVALPICTWRKIPDLRPGQELTAAASETTARSIGSTLAARRVGYLTCFLIALPSGETTYQPNMS